MYRIDMVEKSMMSKYTERRMEILNILKPFIQIQSTESRKQLDKDIALTIHKSVNEAISVICRNQMICYNITPEMKKYLIGQMYRAELIINKYNQYKSSSNNKTSKSKNKDDHIQSAQIADWVGQHCGVSGASVSKYSAYSKAIDNFFGRKTISAIDILLGKIKLSSECITKLSRMSDTDIEYLEYLFHEDYYRFAGYIFMGGETNRPSYSSQSKIKPTDALIKQMPKHDPDAMITSLSLTIHSWINSIQRAIASSDIDKVSETAKTKLCTQLNDLKNIITKTLAMLEEKHNG